MDVCHLFLIYIYIKGHLIYQHVLFKYQTNIDCKYNYIKPMMRDEVFDGSKKVDVMLFENSQL